MERETTGQEVQKDWLLGIAAGTELQLSDADAGDEVTDRGLQADSRIGQTVQYLVLCMCYMEQVRTGQLAEEDAVHRLQALLRKRGLSLRSQIAYGLYLSIAVQVSKAGGKLIDRMQDGLDRGFDYYMRQIDTTVELAYFAELRNLYEFRDFDSARFDKEDPSADYLEGAVWSLITTTSLQHALIKAVGLGFGRVDAAAMTGGLAGLFYGSADILDEWLPAGPGADDYERLCEETGPVVNEIVEGGC